ncbi:MAG TPA: PepSY-associated TM helix domain-containing protein, partial [Puia sp.]|nr:PepSY-associated TM helix domain-containing protein [Puia sp.]
SVFVDPYTGEITGARDYKYDFFNVVKYIHWSLLLNTPYGQPIVAWGTLIFVVLLITGLVLWWPGRWTKAYKDRSFKIKWKASFRRVNYDLHNVPGFYTLIPALILGLTGLVFCFRWFTAFIYLVTTGSATPAPAVYSRSRPPVQVRLADTATAMDKAFVLAEDTFTRSPRIAFSPAIGAEAPIIATGYSGSDTYYGYDVLQLDRYTGRLLSHQENAKKTLGQRLIEMNYDIHVGAIGGLTGKIIAFIVSFICASLPVTGFLVWWNKKKRSHRHAKNLTKSSQPVV